MKIKDIINEQGFGSGFVKGLIGGLKPKAFQDIEQPSNTSGLSDKEAQARAYKAFGDLPGDEGEEAYKTPEQRKRSTAAQKEKAELTQKIAQSKKLKKDLGLAARAAIMQPQTQQASSDYDSNVPPQGQRLAVSNPQGNAKFYKYPDGRWTDEFGTVMPSSSHEALERFADAAGQIEPVTVKGTTGFKLKGARRAK